MFEVISQRIVDDQIEKGTLAQEDRNIYLYGYQMLFEFCVNIITSIIIAVVFRAYDIVLIFTIAYLLLRGYVGGYHARTSLGCFCISAGILIASVIVVKVIAGLQITDWFFLLEMIMLPCVFRGTPMPDVNKPITENESIYFKKKVKQIYTIELVVEMILLFCGLDTFALSIWAVHVVLFIMVLVDFLLKRTRI